MDISREKQLAARLYKIAAADGSVSKEEIDAISQMASTFKDFDGASLIKSFNEEFESPSDLRTLVDSVKADDKAKLIYACADVAFADGIICLDEVCTLHEVADMMDIPAAMVSFYLLKVMRDYPGIKFEGDYE